ncbi:MAG: enoyl-CoA hydratase-related protein, partial [Burkholderiaceae bacterium]
MTQISFETILYDVQDGIATITLNRPDKLNAFTSQMRLDICAALDKTDADDSVRVVIFTGAGRAFCAGADLSAGGKTFNYSERNDPVREATRVGDIYRDGGGITALRIFESLKPVIGAINGAAVGVGVTMQLPMDIRLASDGARFGFVFNRRGVTPEAASSWFLTRAVGMQTALEWCYTGRLVDSGEALSAGLIRSVHPQEKLMPAARELALEIAANAAPVSVAMTRQMMWRMVNV